jgi:uncharacterized membrane protein
MKEIRNGGFSLLEVTIKILGIILLVKLIILAILDLIDAVLPRIRRTSIRLQKAIHEIKRQKDGC